MTLAPGTTVGRYQILEPLGQGGMATVYKALQPSLQREVALKVLRPGYAQDQEFRERFEREAIAIAKLRHPHIVQVFDFEIAQSGEYVLAMEFLEGGTLKERLTKLAAEGRGMDPAESVRIVGDVAEALSYAHEKGVVHRDVKPSNVMLTHKDWAVVTDFGIARILGATSHTQTGVGIGTPEYMAPEQGQGTAIDHRADIYSLGAMAYELLTGRVPYAADTPLAVVLAHIKDPLPLPSKVNPTVGKGLEKALLRALAKDPQARFDSATAFAEALRAGLADDTKGGTMPTVMVRAGAASAPSVRVVPAAPKQVTLSIPPVLARRPVQAVVAGALTLVLIVGGVSVSGALRSAPAPTEAPSASALTRARGSLVWQAKLDGTNVDARQVPAGPGADAGANEFRFVPGAIEFVVNKSSSGGQGFQFNAPGRDQFVFEVDVDFQVVHTVRFQWWEANSQRYGFALDPRLGSAQLEYSRPGGTIEPLAPAVAVDDLRRGGRVTAAVVVERTVFTLFVNGKQVAQAAPDGRVPPLVAPVSVIATGSVVGAARLTGLRVHEVVPGAIALANAATPRPSASPAVSRGALVWQAKMDGTATDVRGPATLGLLQDETASEVRYLQGAIEFVVSKPQGGRSITLANPARETFVLEADIDTQVAGGVSLYWWGTAADPRYRINVNTTSGDVRFDYYKSPTSERIGGIGDAPEVLKGNRFTLTTVVERNKFTAYVGQRKVLEVAPDGRIAPVASSVGVFSSGTSAGTLRITGLRLYELSTTASASALPPGRGGAP